MSSRSTIASTIQSHSPALSRWSSMLPVSTSFAARFDMKGAGSVLSIFATAPLAMASRSEPSLGTMSSRSTGTPALATCAAMPAPIVPEPMTQTFLISPTMLCALQHGRNALPAADALRGKSVLTALAAQQRRRLADDPRAGGAERMPDRDRAAIDIDRLLLEA